MRHRINILVVILLSFFAIINFYSCDKSHEGKPPNYPDALILLPNATDVKHYNIGGSLQLTYKIKEDYPANKTIEAISNKLRQDKWNALKEDYLNPGLPSSHVRGWTSYEDATKNPHQTVNAWQADWENQAGDIVTYIFWYRYGKNERPNLKNLTTYAVFVSAPLAKQNREAVLEFTKKHNAEKAK
jgi:hypothetical protein